MRDFFLIFTSLNTRSVDKEYKKSYSLLMKKYLILLTCLILVSCATCGDKQVDTILNVASSSSFDILEGKTPEQITALLGEPTFIRTEDPHQTWVFKAPDCALFVFFNAEGVSCYTESRGSCSMDVAKQILAEKKATL